MNKSLFFNGGVDGGLIKEVVSSLLPGIEIPNQVLNFWIKCGGGECFETETFLYPLPSIDKENIVEINISFWQNGLNRQFLIFYLGGFGLGSIKVGTSNIFLLRNNFEIYEELTDFNELVTLINEEYSLRYSGERIEL